MFHVEESPFLRIALGPNTRQQKLYFDNFQSDDAQRNEQLDQAASRNPFLQGQTNYNPQEVDQLLRGNTAGENTALRGIADRIVDQQLTAEPAPNAIDVTVPECGLVYEFSRNLQVEGAAPLTLELERANRASAGFILLLLFAVAEVSGAFFPRFGR